MKFYFSIVACGVSRRGVSRRGEPSDESVLGFLPFT